MFPFQDVVEPEALKKDVLDRWLIGVFCLSIILLPIGFLTVKSWATTLSLVAFLSSSILLARASQYPTLSRTDLFLIAAFVLPIVVDASTQLIRGGWNPSEFDAASRLLIFVPVFICLKALKINLRDYLDKAILISSPLALLYLWIDPSHYWGDRWASHPADPNTLGLFTAVFLTYALLRIGSGETNSNKPTSILVSLSISSGFVVLAGTQSRGAWIVAALAMAMATVSAHRRLRDLFLLGLIPSILAAMIALMLQPSLKERAVSIPNEIVGWIQNTEDVTSAAVRLDMIKLSIILASERPLTGYGDGRYVDRALQRSDSARMRESAVAIVNTPHNEVLGKLLRSGVFGAIAALLVLISPIIMLTPRRTTSYWLAIDHRNGFFLAVFGASLTMGVFGLNFTAGFFAVMAAVFIAEQDSRKAENV